MSGSSPYHADSPNGIVLRLAAVQRDGVLLFTQEQVPEACEAALLVAPFYLEKLDKYYKGQPWNSKVPHEKAFADVMADEELADLVTNLARTCSGGARTMKQSS